MHKMARGYELLSDLYKDASGSRPTAGYMAWFEDLSAAEKEREWESLCRRVDESIVEERDYHAARLVAFTAHIQSLMAQFSIDMHTALRWDMEANDADVLGALEVHGDASQEIEHYLYCQGIDFKDMLQFTRIINEAYELV
jgi:hypothetical protein